MPEFRIAEEAGHEEASRVSADGVELEKVGCDQVPPLGALDDHELAGVGAPIGDRFGNHRRGIGRRRRVHLSLYAGNGRLGGERWKRALARGAGATREARDHREEFRDLDRLGHVHLEAGQDGFHPILGAGISGERDRGDVAALFRA